MAQSLCHASTSLSVSFRITTAAASRNQQQRRPSLRYLGPPAVPDGHTQTNSNSRHEINGRWSRQVDLFVTAAAVIPNYHARCLQLTQVLCRTVSVGCYPTAAAEPVIQHWTHESSTKMTCDSEATWQHVAVSCWNPTVSVLQYHTTRPPTMLTQLKLQISK